MQLEDELKYKIHEVSRQLTAKEEEIMQLKVKFKDERTLLENDKKKALKDAQDAQTKIDQ